MKNLYFVLTILFLVSGCNSGPDRIHIEPTNIKKITVYDRGNFSNFDKKFPNGHSDIFSRDTIVIICRLLNASKHITSSKVGVRQTSEFAEFDMYKTDGSTVELTYSVTFYNGNIIWYEGSWFRSDSLYQYLK